MSNSTSDPALQRKSDCGKGSYAPVVDPHWRLMKAANRIMDEIEGAPGRLTSDRVAEIIDKHLGWKDLLAALKEIVEHPAAFSDGANRLWTQALDAIRKAEGKSI